MYSIVDVIIPNCMLADQGIRLIDVQVAALKVCRNGERRNKKAIAILIHTQHHIQQTSHVRVTTSV